MNQVEGLLILLGIPLALLLNGYWLAGLLPGCNALERLALALIFGLALLLAAVAAVNFFQPLAGLWAWVCLAPVAASLLPRNLSLLRRDLAEVGRASPGRVAAGVALFLGALLWPMWTSSTALFYDGTSNHDSFFWIAGAEHLKRHTYMELPARSAVQPLTNPAAAIVGWRPDWGRMGAEGLLAVTSSLIGASPIKLYLYAIACLYLVWLAAGYLALKTFVTEKPGILASLALATLQPVFTFFYGNANLPNLIGALMGAAFVIGFERALRSRLAGTRDSDGYLILVALSFHGLLCAYPEMAPFVLLPAGLLWLRCGLTHGIAAGWWPCLLSGGAVLVGLAMNCATAVRAFHGFAASFGIARADQNWANLFNPLEYAEYIPALATLSVPASRLLGSWAGWGLSAVLLFAFCCMVRQARDRFGLLAAFSGSGILLLYTLVTGFAYGWQKTVQFGGVFVAMGVSAAALHGLSAGLSEAAGRLHRVLLRLAMVALIVFLAVAAGMNFRETYKWSERKVLSTDWFALRSLSRTTLRHQPVLVEAATFPMAFFHGMWTAYFLDDSHLYFGARGKESGGYLRAEVVNEARQEIPEPAAILVGRAWADTVEAHSPRLLTGREYVLLRRSNRITALSGLFPLNGLPNSAANRIALDIKPATPATLRFTLNPRPGGSQAPALWQIQRRGPDGADYTAEVGGPPPWRITVPLLARQKQSVAIALAGAEPDEGAYPYVLTEFSIVPEPAPLPAADGRIDFAEDANWIDYDAGGLEVHAPSHRIVVAPADAILRLLPGRSDTDVHLELVAEPLFDSDARQPLQTELWFNQALVFSGYFTEPGVLRARIPREFWNEHPVGTLKLRFPDTTPTSPRLLLKVLTTRPSTDPRP